MNDILLETSELDIVQALESNLQEHVWLYARLPGANICDEPGVVGLMTDLDISESCVYQANFQPDQAYQKIERVWQHYHSQGCLPMWWIVGPSTQPPDLGNLLEAQGFQCIAHPPGMAAQLDGLVEQAEIPGHFAVERVSNSSQLKQWTEIVGIADGIPKALETGFYEVFEHNGYVAQAACQLFLGMEDGKPVATSRLFCAGEVAGIYHVATLPEKRGRGYGTVMTLAAAHAGHKEGCQEGVLFATPAGYGIYRRLGFHEYCRLDVYKSPDMNK
jgi:GNAT superfamily N-acetyltransferase